MSRGKKRKLVEMPIETIASIPGGLERLEDAIAGLPPEALPEVCPFPGDHSMGDKDPEVMAWYRDNAPEEFERRYANRVIPAVLPEPPLERGPISDFEDEADEVRKPKVIM